MAKSEKPTAACSLNPNFLAPLTLRRCSAALGSSLLARSHRTPHSSHSWSHPHPILPLCFALHFGTPPAGQQAADDDTTRWQTSRALAAHESRSISSRTSSSRVSTVRRTCRPQARDHRAPYPWTSSTQGAVDLEHTCPPPFLL